MNSDLIAICKHYLMCTAWMDNPREKTQERARNSQHVDAIERQRQLARDLTGNAERQTEDNPVTRDKVE